MNWQWSKIQHTQLTRYVVPGVREKLRLTINVNDLLQHVDGKTEIVRAIYAAFLEKSVQYALDKYEDPAQTVQTVRKPSEILGDCPQGNCLDLALIFCGVCLDCELLPILIVLEGHVFAAVSLHHRRRDWQSYSRNEYESLFKFIKTTDGGAVRELVECGDYLPIECTGFAQTRSLPASLPEGIGRQVDGTLTFERAVEAGREQFQHSFGRRFRFALDIPVARYFHKLDHLGDASETARSPSKFAPGLGRGKGSRRKNVLSSNLDRSEQMWDFKREIVEQHNTKPLRPLVLIVHGNEDECHSELLERFWEFLRPVLKYCNPGRARLGPRGQYTLNLSLNSMVKAGDDQHFLWETLITQVDRKGCPTRQQLVSLITGKRSAVMINASLTDWDGANCERLDSFFEFWNSWRDLPADFLLLVCLCIRYPKPFGADRVDVESISTMRSYINGLGDFAKYKHMRGSVVSELQAIARHEAAALVINESVRKEYPDLQLRDIQKLYLNHKQRTSEPCIPMDTLLSDLYMFIEAGQSETLDWE